VFGFAVDDREKAKKKFRFVIGRRRSASERGDGRTFGPVGGPVFRTCVLVFFVVYGWHDGGYHFALEAGKAPCFGRKLHDALHCDLDPFLLFRVSEMLDRVDDLFYDGAGCCVDALLGAAARESCKESLLAPDGFLAGALVTDVVAHREEERVCFVISTTETEEEWTEYTVCHELRDCVGDVRGAELPVLQGQKRQQIRTERTLRRTSLPKMRVLQTGSELDLRVGEQLGDAQNGSQQDPKFAFVVARRRPN